MEDEDESARCVGQQQTDDKNLFFHFGQLLYILLISISIPLTAVHL